VIVIVGVIAIVALLVFLVMHRKQNAAKSSHWSRRPTDRDGSRTAYT
jgi:FtsZ-interacting cell division protein ZipA